jgi:hypothetical protein
MSIGQFADLSGLSIHALRRLDRLHSHLTARIKEVDRMLEEGMTMPATPVGCRPVQIKLAVADTEIARAFYQAAFGFRYDVTRRTEDEDYSSFLFGEYGRDDFFLLHLEDDENDADRPARRRSACWWTTSPPCTRKRWPRAGSKSSLRTIRRACPDARQ